MYYPPTKADLACKGARNRRDRNGGTRVKVVSTLVGTLLCAAFFTSLEGGIPADSGTGRLTPLGGTASQEQSAQPDAVNETRLTQSVSNTSLSPIAIGDSASTGKGAEGSAPEASSGAGGQTAAEQGQTADVEAVRNAVEAWARAWSARDVDGYLGAYAKAFAPENGLSRSSWEQSRRQRIETKKNISVSLRDIQVEADGNSKVKVSFLQDYAADGFRETGSPKELIFARENNAWRIISETNRKAGSKSQ